MSPRTRDWLIAIGYVALIYCTLEVARLPFAYLRAHGWLRISISISFLVVSVVALRTLLKNHPKNFVRVSAFAALLVAYYAISHTIKIPEEQLHFFEYGLVGIFFLRALRHHVQTPVPLFIGAWIISSIAGWMDELLQGLTPTRRYDLHDVALNAIAAGLGLFAYLICKKTKTPR